MQDCILQLWHGWTIWAGDLHDVGLPTWSVMFTAMLCFYAHDEARSSYFSCFSHNCFDLTGHWVSISWVAWAIAWAAQSLLKQQWGGIKWSREVTSSEYMKGEIYFKYCRRLQIGQYIEIPKVMKYQHHGCKRKYNTSELEVGAPNARKQHGD